MQLVTWNCNQAFRRKQHQLLDIDPDIAVVPECEHPAEKTDDVDVLAVWAMNDEENPRRRYIGQVHTALKNHPGLVDENTVVAGDFNWNVIWDESPDGPLCGDFADTREVYDRYVPGWFVRGLATAFGRVAPHSRWIRGSVESFALGDRSVSVARSRFTD